MSLLKKFLKKEDNKVLIFDSLIILLILALPYYIFEGKLFIGGDETRLQYLYPFEWIKRVYYYSWYGFAPLGTFNSIQFTIPFLSIFAVLKNFVQSLVVLNYLAFSTPLILGFVFFKKIVEEFEFEIDRWVITLGSLFYVFSPILIYKIIGPFLFAVWLVGYLPILGLLFFKYLKSGKPIYILINVIITIFLAIVFNAIPWFLGAVLPAVFVLPLGLFLFKKNDILLFLKRSALFVIFLVFSQFFWLLSYLSAFLSSAGSYPASVLSTSVKSSFVTTVLATSGENNIIYPLLNLFHRGIAFSSNWALKDVYVNFYDYTYFINIIFPLMLIIGLLNVNKIKSLRRKKIFILAFFAFLFSLFFFTVNIGPLKSLFLWLGNIPGFVMFRNFYGKFSLAYVIYFALFFTFCMDIAIKNYPRFKNRIILFVFTVIVINLIPVKQNINIPLWQTEKIYTTMNLPQEYLDFMSEIESSLPPDSAILSIPLNVASYSIIKDKNSDNIYAGSSPIKLFTDIPAFTGNFSFSSVHDDRRKIAQNMNTWMQERDFNKLNELLYKYNIGYVLVTKNIPKEVEDSYLFNYKTLPYQDEKLVTGLSDKKILESRNGNYALYELDNKNSLLSSENLSFQKVNSVKYRLYIKGIEEDQELIFLNTFNYGWNLYLVQNPSNAWCDKLYLNKEKSTTLCKNNFSFVNGDELSFSFKEPVFKDTHEIVNGYANKWTLSTNEIKTRYDKSYYKINPDGTVDIELILYFVPQNYFYFGAIVSTIAIILLISWTLYYQRRRKK